VKVLDSLTEIEELLRRLPVNELCGIARASVARLEPHGIRNCWEFAQADPVLIRKLLTVKGEGILWELRGQSIIPLNTERPAHKAISRGGSMGETTTDPGRLRAWIVRHSERLVDELDYHGVLTGQLSVNLAFKHEDGITARVRLQTPQSAFAEISRAALEAFERELLPRIRPTTHVHLIADQLVLRRAFQRGLFDEPGSTQLDDLRRAINKKLGIASVRSAATLPLNGVYDDPLALYDVCDIRGKQCF
jgi:nucleotidyltransferase/DNA polymerase involved in DNA repair